MLETYNTRQIERVKNRRRGAAGGSAKHGPVGKFIDECAEYRLDDDELILTPETLKDELKLRGAKIVEEGNSKRKYWIVTIENEKPKRFQIHPYLQSFRKKRRPR